MLHVELKKWGGTTSVSQKTEHDILRRLGHNVEIVKEKTPYQALERVKELIEQYEPN